MRNQLIYLLPHKFYLIILLILLAPSMSSFRYSQFSFSKQLLNFLNCEICSFKTSKTFSLFCIKMGTHIDGLLFANLTVLAKPAEANSKIASSSFSFSKTVFANANDVICEI